MHETSPKEFSGELRDGSSCYSVSSFGRRCLSGYTCHLLQANQRRGWFRANGKAVYIVAEAGMRFLCLGLGGQNRI